MNEIFGPHLMMDLSGCKKEILQDLKLHFDYLNNTPEIIGMTKITQPHVFPYQGLVPEDKGTTGVVIIAESHISVHSFEDKGYVFVDIFSCKPFNTELMIQKTLECFKPTSYEIKIERRGLNFPRQWELYLPMIVDLLQKKWDYIKEEIDRLDLCPPSEDVRKKIRFLKSEASVIKFAIEDMRSGLPNHIVLDNLKSNRDFYKRIYKIDN